MKKIVLFFASVLFAFVTNAQSIKDVLSIVKNASSSSIGQTVGSVVDNMIGTKNVSAKSLVGTWKYKQPAVAFESENAISTIGGSVASGKIETKLATIFSKVGITPGKLSITFKSDGTFSTVVKSKTITGIYKLNGSTITFAKSTTAKTKITANVKMGTTLQLTFKTDKLLQFVQQFASVASSVNNSLTTVTSLMKNYKGMQVGMRFNK